MRLGGPMRSMNTTTSRCSTRPRQEATVRGVRWALRCTRGRDWASETPRSLRRPPSTFPLHCTHPSSSTDSTCLRPRHAMGYLRLVVIAVRQGTPRPAGGTVVGNFVQPPATISTGLGHLYACSRLRLGGGPQEDLGGGVLVNIGYGFSGFSPFDLRQANASLTEPS